MKSFLNLLLGGVLLTACSTPKAPDTVNVQTLNQQFVEAWNAKNTVQLDSLLADDVQFVQGEAHFSGKAEVADKWIRATQNTISNLKTSTVSTGTDANLAYEAGTFSVDVLPEDPRLPRGTGTGNFLLLWTKTAKNNWKLSLAQLEGLPVQVRR